MTKNNYFLRDNFSLTLHRGLKFPVNWSSFPCSEKSLSIPGFPGLWPPRITLHWSQRRLWAVRCHIFKRFKTCSIFK